MMAIPVLFTAELFPWSELNGNRLNEAIADFNGELREFFAERVKLVEIPADTSNLTETTTAYGTNTDNVPFVTATVVIGFLDIDLEAAKPLAAQFKTAKFNHASAEVLDPEDHLTPQTG